MCTASPTPPAACSTAPAVSLPPPAELQVWPARDREGVAVVAGVHFPEVLLAVAVASVRMGGVLGLFDWEKGTDISEGLVHIFLAMSSSDAKEG